MTQKGCREAGTLLSLPSNSLKIISSTKPIPRITNFGRRKGSPNRSAPCTNMQPLLHQQPSRRDAGRSRLHCMQSELGFTWFSCLVLKTPRSPNPCVCASPRAEVLRKSLKINQGWKSTVGANAPTAQERELKTVPCPELSSSQSRQTSRGYEMVQTLYCLRCRLFKSALELDVNDRFCNDKKKLKFATFIQLQEVSLSNKRNLKSNR